MRGSFLPRERATGYPPSGSVQISRALLLCRDWTLCHCCSAVEATVPARGKALLSTDLSIAIPSGYYARVAPRSGLAWKNSIDVGAGVIGKGVPVLGVACGSRCAICDVVLCCAVIR